MAKRAKSAFSSLQEKLTPAPVVEMPKVASFEQFLTEVARVRVQSGELAGTYRPFSFAGRDALLEVVRVIDHILGSHTGVPLKDSKVALAGGAQFGKTTLELQLEAYATSCRFLNTIAYLPDDTLAEAIVDAKFRPDVVDQIPWFAKMAQVGRSVNESGKAVNTKGAFLVTDGKRKAVGMFRGLQKPPTSFTADIVIEDEKDDIKAANAKFVSGRMTASELRFHLEIGTQRVHGAGQNLVWKQGTQGVVLLASKRTWEDSKAIARYLKKDYGHTYVTEVPKGFVNPEEAWPKICRLMVSNVPRTDDPVLGYEGDFRRPGSDEVIGVYTPDAPFYYAHPETGEVLDAYRPIWHHRVPAMLAMRRFSFRVAQIGTPAIDLAQIVAHWTRAVGDAEEMVVFRCDRQAMPKSASQALTPEIIERSRKVDSYLAGERRAAPHFAGLDMGDRCWYIARETAHPGDKRIVNAQQIAIGDVVGRVCSLFVADDISTLFIDERPAVSEARTLSLLLNGLNEMSTWPTVDWRNREAYVALPGGLTWDGRNQRWLNLRCAVVRFTKNQLGAGIEQGGVEFEEQGVRKFVPVIACNRFETIDRVVRELLCPTENVIEMIKGADGKNVIRQDPAMRLPRKVLGMPKIFEAVEAHFIAGSQRVKDDRTGELGEYIDGIDNHLLFANGYSALAETIGGTGKAAPLAVERIPRAEDRGGLLL